MKKIKILFAICFVVVSVFCVFKSFKINNALGDDTPSISYSGSFRETSADIGAVSGSRVATITGDTFTNAGGVWEEGTYYYLTNKPFGLSSSMAVSSDGTTATLTFSGNANSSTNYSDVSNLTITFLDGAFTNNPIASDVTNYTDSNGVVDFVSINYWKELGPVVGSVESGVDIISLKIDSNDVPYVAFKDSNNSYGLTVKKWNGSAWSVVGSENFSSGAVYNISFTIDKNDVPYVAYTDSTNSSKITVMTFNGSSWVLVGTAGFSTGEATATSIATDNSYTPIPYVSFFDSSGNVEVMKFVGIDETYTTGWQKVGLDITADNTVTDTSIALNSSNIPYVAYVKHLLYVGSYTFVLEYSSDVWTAVGDLSTVQLDYNNFAIDSQDNLYVSFVSIKDGSYMKSIKITKWDGSAWVDLPIAFTLNPTTEIDISSISLALDKNDIPYVAYPDYGYTGDSPRMATVVSCDNCDSKWNLVGNSDFSYYAADDLSLSLDSNNIPYLAFNGESFNEVDSGAIVMTFKTVEQVVGLSATAGDSEVDLSWTQLINDGYFITDYIIEYKLSSGGSWSTFDDGTSENPTATVTGLSNGSSYDFRVKAYNSVLGEGTVSSVATATPVSATSAPSQVTGLSANTDSISEINLSWTAPDDGGSDITDYLIEYKLTSDSSWSTFNDGTSTEITETVNDLDSDTSYDFRVSAINSVGTGTASDIASATTKKKTSSGSSASQTISPVTEPITQPVTGPITPVNPPITTPTEPAKPINNEPKETKPPQPDEVAPVLSPIEEPVVEDLPPTEDDTKQITEPGDSLWNTISKEIRKSFVAVSDASSSAYWTAKEEINKKEVSVFIKILTTAGIAIGALFSVLPTLFASPFSFSEIVLLPFRIWSLLLAALGLKKRNRPWGTVYDSVTKQPLDPAYVILKDENGKEIASSITDLDGRYGFLVEEGNYTLEVNKTDYKFPSKNLEGKNSDELYQNLYQGEVISVMNSEEVITKNIPMDPIKFNWNEFAKKQQKLNKFYSRKDFIFNRISTALFILGGITSILALLLAPEPYNIIIFAVYIVLFVLRQLGIRPKDKGTILENNHPLPFSIIRVFQKATNTEIIHKVSDKHGKFYCLVPNGSYYIKIEKKLESGDYETVHVSGIIDVAKGLIKGKFEV
ncbi:MAG TPA: fibronectin type III domain-containing protein [Candidatus Paceibacterota bacterium]|nr:fibronectin type III domain-containing protein [Candidatus Paceibacterota bacterium]HPT18198.1 fibronectin type III domain-containing protein [Candidatus Paceibacterota bacterium]